MNLFNKLFGGAAEAEQPSGFWNHIKSQEDLEKAVQESYNRKVAIFKHSTRCFISKTVLTNFEKEVAASDKDVSFYFLDLLAYRDLSNKIADDFAVPHQSPQLIVLQNGSAVKNASHQSISLSLT